MGEGDGEGGLNLAHAVLFSHGEAVRELAIRVKRLEEEFEIISRPERLQGLAEALADCVDALQETGQCCVAIDWSPWGAAESESEIETGDRHGDGDGDVGGGGHG